MSHDKKNILQLALSALDMLIDQDVANRSSDDVFYSYNSKSPVAYLKCARAVIENCVSALKSVSVQENGTQSTSELPTYFIDALRALDKSFGKLSLKSHSRSKDSPVNTALQHILIWSRAVLRMMETLQRMSGIIGLEAGIKCIQLNEMFSNVEKSLSEYMGIQRIHTAHNYIIRPGERCDDKRGAFFCDEVDTVGLYEALCSSDFEMKMSMERNRSTFVMPSGEHQPLQHWHRRVQSAKRCVEMWWWDAVRACDWSLLRRLIDDIIIHESASKLELLVVEMVRRRAPYALLTDIISRGARFGRTTEHLEIAVSRAEPRIFLVIFYAGTFSQSPQIWEAWLKLFHNSGHDGKGHHQHIPGQFFSSKDSYVFDNSNSGDRCTNVDDLDSRRRVMLNVLLAGRKHSSDVDPEYAMPNVINGQDSMLSKVFELSCQSGCSDNAVTNDVDGNDSASESDADGCEYTAIYQSCEEVSRHPLGGIVLVSSRPHHHSLASLGITASVSLTGLLTMNGNTILPLTLSLLNTDHRLPMAAFLQRHNRYMVPYDRFLCHTAMKSNAFENVGHNYKRRHRYDIVAETTIQHALLSETISSGSPSSVKVIVETLLSMGVDIDRSHVISKWDEKVISCSLLSHAARAGNIAAVRALLEVRKRKGPDIRSHENVYHRGTKSERIEVSPLGFVQQLRISLDRQVTERQERREQMLSGIRGFYNHQGLNSSHGSLNRVMTNSLPIQRIIQNMCLFCRSAIDLRRCDLTWSQMMHHARTSFSFNKTNVAYTEPDMTLVMFTIGIADIYSLSKFIEEVVICPIAACEKAAVALQSNPLTCDYDPLLVAAVPTTSSDQKGSLALLIFKQWLGSVVFLFGSSGVEVLQLCGVMRDMFLLGGRNSMGDISGWISDDDGSRDRDNDIDSTRTCADGHGSGWFDCADDVISEVRLLRRLIFESCTHYVYVNIGGQFS